MWETKSTLMAARTIISVHHLVPISVSDSPILTACSNQCRVEILRGQGPACEVSSAGLLVFAVLLTELSQLRAIFGSFAVIFVVKSCASIAELWKNGRVETKCLPFAPGLLAICRQHVSAQQQSQKRRQGSSLLQHRRKPSQRFGQDGAANRSLSRRDQRSATSGMAQDVVGV